MLKKYKNELFQIIQNSGIDLSLVRHKEEVINEYHAFTVEIINTPFWFMARNSSHDYEIFDCKYVQFNPSFSESGYMPEDGWCSFIDIKNMFTNWLQSHVQEYFNDLTEPDFWLQLNSESKALDLGKIDFDDKELFNAEEKQQIKLALRDVRLLIIDRFSPSALELESINARLDYLSQAVDRLNKFDWKSLLLSTIMSISVALSFDTEKGKQLYTLFKHVFDVIPKLIY
jgi:hypothetical protein